MIFARSTESACDFLIGGMRAFLATLSAMVRRRVKAETSYDAYGGARGYHDLLPNEHPP